MTLVKAELKNHRQAPRKVRLVVNAVRGKDIDSAMTMLTFTTKKASLPIKKLIASAVANATHNFNMKPENLFIKEITVDGGPILKRWRARARGRAFPIHKHTSHIKIVLADKTEKDVKEAPKKEATKLVVKKTVAKKPATKKPAAKKAVTKTNKK